MPVTVGVPLDDDHVAAVHGLRQRLGVPEDPAWVPHLSLVVVLREPDSASLDDAIRATAAAAQPFRVRARGVGVFADGDHTPVLHVPVVRTAELARLHLDLYQRVTASGGRVDGQYAPASWFPHVTLWDRAPVLDDLATAVADLVRGAPIAWTLPITTLARLDHGAAPLRVPIG